MKETFAGKAVVKIMANSFGNDWMPCPNGELKRLATRLWFKRLSAAALTCLLAVFTAGAVSFAAYEVHHAVSPRPMVGYLTPATSCPESPAVMAVHVAQ
jgi:hypothetical protein